MPEAISQRLALSCLAIAGSIAVAALVYAATTSWQNSEHITQIAGDIKGIKRALIEISIKADPSDLSVSLDLLSNTTVRSGAKEFQSKNIPKRTIRGPMQLQRETVRLRLRYLAQMLL